MDKITVPFLILLPPSSPSPPLQYLHTYNTHTHTHTDLQGVALSVLNPLPLVDYDGTQGVLVALPLRHRGKLTPEEHLEGGRGREGEDGERKRNPPYRSSQSAGCYRYRRLGCDCVVTFPGFEGKLAFNYCIRILCNAF